MPGLLNRIGMPLALTATLYLGPLIAEVMSFIKADSRDERAALLASRFQLDEHWTISFRNLIFVSIV
jgi:hypothetical protein